MKISCFPMRCDVSQHVPTKHTPYTHSYTHSYSMHARESIQIWFNTVMLPPSCDINSYVNTPLMCLYADMCMHTQTQTHTLASSLASKIPWIQLKSLKLWSTPKIICDMDTM